MIITTDTTLQLARAMLVLHEFSVDVSEVIERSLGEGASGNSEVQLLTHLFLHGESSPVDLRTATGLSRTGVARVVDRLVALGLVQRRHGIVDRRTVRSSLTRVGRRRLTALHRDLEAHLQAQAPLVSEFCELARGLPSSNSGVVGSLDVIGAIGRLGAVGAPLNLQLDLIEGLANARHRVVVAALYVSEQLRPGQLATIVGMSSGGVTYLLDQLVAEGFVERGYGTVQEDRRAVVVMLTEKGRTAARTIAGVLAEHVDSICDALSSTQLSGEATR